MEGEKPSEYFEYNIMSFKVTGIWIDLMNMEESSCAKILYCFIVNALFILAPQICHVIYMYNARDNVEAFADEFHVSLSSLMVVLKSYSFIRYFGIVNKLIISMDDEVYQPKNGYQKKQTTAVSARVDLFTPPLTHLQYFTIYIFPIDVLEFLDPLEGTLS